MKIYLDLIFFMNFAYDFLLLLTVSFTLKRNKKIYRHIISAFVGALSIFLLFIDLPIISFLIKILVSIIMCLISFSYVSIRYTLNNLLYLYMVSIILAGFLYLLNNEVSLSNKGLLFINNNTTSILLIIISPIILYIYYKSSKKLKNTYNLYYYFDIYFSKKKIRLLGLFDNGNNLYDPVSKKRVIIVNSKKLKEIHNKDPVYVVCNTINKTNLMKCYKPSYIKINNKKYKNFLIGVIDYNFSDGVEALLNNCLMEDLCLKK